MKPIVRGILICLLITALVATGSIAHAQQSGQIPRVGYLSAGGPNSLQVVAFRQGLQDLGYAEGKNVTVEYRYIEGNVDRIPGLVRELVQLKVDVFVSTNFPAIQAAKQVTKTIPVVMVITQDPVATGLVNSLARPGSNITGLTRLTRGLSGKRLELLMEVVSSRSIIGVLWDMNAPGPILGLKEYEAAASALKLHLQSIGVRGPNPYLEDAFVSAAKQHVNAVIAILNPVLNLRKKRIADLAIKYRIPSMCERRDYVEAGCLLSYSADEAESYRRAAIYVDKILKGAKPADLPIERPTRFEFVINLKTAKQIGLTLPPNVLARANKVLR